MIMLQKQLLNCSSLGSTNSAMIQSDSLGLTARTPESRKSVLQSAPLLYGLLKGNPTKKESLPTLSSLSEGNNGNNCRHPTTQNPHSSRTQTRPHQQQYITSSVCSQRDLPAGKTDKEILDYIKEKLRMFRNTNKRLNSNHTDSLKSSRKSDTSAHSTSFNFEEGQGLDCAVTEHYSSTPWPQREMESSEGSKAIPEFAVKSDVTDSCATSAPEQHPTEYPQIMQKVAGSRAKIDDDEIAVILTTLSEMTKDELAENHPGSTLKRRSSEGYKTPWLNTNSNLDNVNGMPGASWSLMSEKKRGTVLGATEVGQVDCVEDHSMYPSFKSSLSQAFKVVSDAVKAAKPKNTEEHQVIQHTGHKFESQADKIPIHDVKALQEQSGEHYNQNHLEGKQGAVCLGFGLFESKAERQKPLPESKVEIICKNPHYEDISDEDQSCMVTQGAKTKHGGSDVLISCRDPQYEDISEDDNSQNRKIDLEIQMAEPNSVESPLEYVGFRCKQGPAEMRADISVKDHAREVPDKGQKCCCPYYVETEHGFESTLCPICERQLEQQKDQAIVCSSSSDEKNEDADAQNSDSDAYDDFIVIPLIASNVKFESEDQIDQSKEIVVLSDDETSETEGEGRQAGSCSTHYDLHHPVSKPQPANNIEIYGTLESYLQEQNLSRSDHLAAESNVASDRITPECEMSSRGPMPHPTVTSDTDGSSETDDSCNYSSDPQSNYMTVSKSLLMNRSCGPVGTDDSASAAEDELNDDMNAHTSKTMACSTSKAGLLKSPFMQKLGELINTKSGLKRNRLKTNKHRSSKLTDTSDSESEDESGQKHKKMKKRIFSSRSNSANTQHHGHPQEVVNSQMYHAQIEAVINDDTTGKTRYPVETNACNGHVSHKTNRRKILGNEHSDSQDRRDRNSKKLKRECSSSEELGKTGKAQRHSPEQVYIQSKTGTEKVKKSIQSSANLSHAQNKGYDLQLGDVTENACSDLSNSGQRIKAKAVSKHRRKTSEDKRFLLKSEPKRRSAETVNQLCGASGKPSSENSAEKPQSVAKGSLSSPIIPHLVVDKSTEHCDVLKLLHKDETRTLKTTGTTKKNDSSKKTKLKHLNKSENGKFVPKLQLPKDKHCESVNRDQASKAQPFSRQLSLPNHPSKSENNYESRNRSPYFSRGLSCDAEISVSSNKSTLEQNPSVPKQRSSTLQQSHSSVSHHHGTHSRSVCPPTMQTSAKKQVTKNWNDSYFPTRRDKKNLEAEEDTTSNSIFVKNASGKLCHDSSKEPRPGPSHDRVRHRNNSHETGAPLMKRAKDDFRKLKEGRIRDPSAEQSCNVGKGYKWKEKPPAVKLQKVKATKPHR